MPGQATRTAVQGQESPPGDQTGHKVPSVGGKLSLVVRTEAPSRLSPSHSATHNQSINKAHQPFCIKRLLTPFQEKPSPRLPLLPHSPTIAEPSRKSRPGQETNGFGPSPGGGALRPSVSQASFSPGSCSLSIFWLPTSTLQALASDSQDFNTRCLDRPPLWPHRIHLLIPQGPLRFHIQYSPSQRNVSHSRHLLPCGQPGEGLGPLGLADRKLAGPGLPRCQLLCCP